MVGQRRSGPAIRPPGAGHEAGITYCREDKHAARLLQMRRGGRGEIESREGGEIRVGAGFG